MPRNDDSLERLRAAIDELAAADAADLLAEARIEARARVRATLTDALAHSMLEQLHEQLPASRPTPRTASRPTPRTAPRPTPRTAPRAPAQRAPAPSAAPAPGPVAHGEQAWYVYGVVSSETELSAPLAGVDPAWSVTLLREDALAAVASQVPMDEFDEVRLREHLADMAWVEATARAHEAVLDQVRELATVIPMRMCTVYRTDGGAREMLRREVEPLQEALEHLRGKSEWGVKVFAQLESGGDPSPFEGETSGTAYLERKRSERDRHERLLDTIEEATARIHDRLSAVASDALVVPPQRPEASGHPGEMALNGVYLVPDDAVEAFHAEVRALQAELGGDGLELEPTGPWPAYNFVPGTIGAAW